MVNDTTNQVSLLEAFCEHKEQQNEPCPVHCQNVSLLETLHEHKRRYERLLHTITDYIYMVDIGYGTSVSTFHGPGCARVTGYTPEEFEADPYLWYRMVHKEDRQQVVAIPAYIAESHQPISLDHRIIHKDGSIRWVNNTVIPRYDDSETMVAYDGVITDITPRKTIEAELEQRVDNRTHMLQKATAQLLQELTRREKAEKALNRLASIVASSDDAIIGKTRDGIIEDWNVGAERLFGYTAQEMIGQHISLLSSDEYVEETNTFLRIIRDGGHIAGIETMRRCKDGTLIHISLTMSPMKDLDGNNYGISTIARDIGDRKRMEKELRQALQAAEDAAHAKSEFLARMSHEIRTPLNAVIGMTGLLLDTPLLAKQLDFVKTIRISGEALLSVINDILDYSKIEAGKVQLEHQPFNIRTCIEESLDLLAPKAAEKNLNLAYMLGDTIPETLIGDVTRIRQILVNLVSNAVKFTDRGEIVVTAEIPSLDMQHQHSKHPDSLAPDELPLHLSVRDTGIGIPHNRLELLFQPFQQVDTSTTRLYGGTGLGLAISKRFAEMMGGSIWAESSQGQGSTFHVALSVAATMSLVTSNYVCAITQQQQILQAAHNVSHEVFLLRHKRILIVDDNATNRLILERQTQLWGMEPVVLSSGDEALQWFQQGHMCHFAIIDMHMPHMDGLTLIQHIRSLQTQHINREPMYYQEYDSSSIHNILPCKSKMLSIILYTSIIVKNEIMSNNEDHIAAFLTKPIKPHMLRDTLIQVCKGEKMSMPTSMASSYDSAMGTQHPLRILLAEDNVVNQKVALCMLERIGYRADVVANGLEVLQAVARQPYDLVLMDVQMPEMDGIRATRHVRDMLSEQSVPWIVAMTAHAMDGDKTWLMDNGMDDYVSKPVRMEELIQTLLRVERKHSVDDYYSLSFAAKPISTACVVLPATSATSATNPVTTPCPHAKTPAPANTTLDVAVLENFIRLAGAQGQAIVSDLISLYIQDSPRLITNIMHAVQQQDVSQYTLNAHSLKSSSAQLGAMKLSSLCKTLEMYGRTLENNNHHHDTTNGVEHGVQTDILHNDPVTLAQTIETEFEQVVMALHKFVVCE